MAAPLIWLALALGALWVPFSERAPSRLRSALKMGPCLALAAAAWVGDFPLLSIALVLSALGDLMLSRPGELMFRRAMELFAAAHLVFVLIFGNPVDGVTLFPIAAVALVLLALSTEVWLIPRTGALAWYVRIYVGVIAAMGLAALGFDHPSVMLGAGAFILSDLVLAARKFVLGEGHPWAAVAGWAVWGLYVLGQALITGGLLGLV